MRSISLLIMIAIFSDVTLAHGQAAPTPGRPLIVGQIPDVVFAPGVQAKTMVSYQRVTLAQTGEETCYVLARSMTPGVSVVDSYGGNPTVRPFGEWAAVGGASTGNYRFPIVYDGMAPNGTRGRIEMSYSDDCMIPFTGLDNGLIATFNVFIEANPQPTWFFVTATAGTTTSNFLVLDHPYLNGDDAAKIFVSPVYNPDGSTGGIFSNHPISVNYDSAISRWVIQYDDFSTMLIGTSFSVHIDNSAKTTSGRLRCKGPSNCVRIFIFDAATEYGTAWRNPNATVMITAVNGTVNPRHVSVKYVGDSWYIVNTDGSAFPPNGLAFNVKIFGYSSYIDDTSVPITLDLTTTNGVGIDVDSNTARNTGSGRNTLFWWQSGFSRAPMIVTANQNPQNRSVVVTNGNYYGVEFTTGVNPSCRVVHQDPTSTMPTNASFNAWAPPLFQF